MATRNAYPLDGAQATLYEKGMDIANEYSMRPGVCVLPLAEDPPESEGELASYSPVVVARLHAPYRIRKVKYQAVKTNTPPVMPSPVDAGSFVFVGGSIGISNNVSFGQTTFDWQAATIYYYVENCPYLIGDGLVLGSPPWMSAAAVATANTMGGYQTPQCGSTATAGVEVLYAKTMGDQITFQPGPYKGAYYYSFPSYYPGSFFNDYLVNGGVPTVPDPRASQYSGGANQ